jgi:hypothetical protein
MNTFLRLGGRSGLGVDAIQTTFRAPPTALPAAVGAVSIPTPTDLGLERHNHVAATGFDPL